MYGVLFAAMIQGSGQLIDDEDEDGNDLPFLTTDQILEQIKKFGFYVIYDVKSNLPDATLDFFQSLLQLGYEKITAVLLQTTDKDGNTIWKKQIIIFKPTEQNMDLMSYGMKLSRAKYLEKVNSGSIINATHEKGIKWDWVDSLYGLADIMEENADKEDPFTADTEVENLRPLDGTEGFTVHEDPDDEESILGGNDDAE